MIFATFLMTSFLTEKARLAASVSSKGSVIAAIKISVNHYVKIISGAFHCVKSVRIRSFLVRFFQHSDQKNSKLVLFSRRVSKVCRLFRKVFMKVYLVQFNLTIVVKFENLKCKCFTKDTFLTFISKFSELGFIQITSVRPLLYLKNQLLKMVI